MAKRALVVGINDYSAQNIGKLDWCVSDANSMYHLLINAFGFDADNVFLYPDSKATRHNILSTLSYILSESEPGDVVCLYFAGHGGILPATANVDNTRFYEAIIPYKGEWIFDLDIDETLYHSKVTLEEINFTVILDSCHAGGMSNTDLIEQSIPRSVPFDPLVAQSIQNIQTMWPFGICLPNGSEELLFNVGKPRIEQNRLVDLEEDTNKTLVETARATLLAACKYYETAGEDPKYRHGYFTKAFLDIVNSSNFQVTYDDIMNRLITRVNTLSSNTQTPQLRGQLGRMDHQFLQGWNTSI